MTDRQKPKTNRGERNADRRNGKAPKKNPKNPAKAKTPARTWEARKEQRRLARLAAGKREKWEARQARNMDAAQRLALENETKRKRSKRQSDAQRRRQREQDANAAMVEMMRNGQVPS